jgi:hypothetical protein
MPSSAIAADRRHLRKPGGEVLVLRYEAAACGTRPGAPADAGAAIG